MPPQDISSSQYVDELQAEKARLDPSCVHAIRLLAQEIDHVLTGPDQEKLLDLQPDKQTSLAVRVRLPVKEYPKVNFAGRIIGPKGSTMKDFQEKTGTKLYVLGRGSMTDKKKEEDLRQSGGKYAHLNQDLHVRLESFAHPVEAYRRMSAALHELSAYLGPDEVTPGPSNGAPYPGMRQMLQPGMPAQPGVVPGPHGASMMAPRPPHRFPPDAWPMYQEPTSPVGSYAARQARPSYPGQLTRHPATAGGPRPTAATSFGQYQHGALAQQPGDFHSQRAPGGKTLPYQTVGQYRAHPY